MYATDFHKSQKGKILDMYNDEGASFLKSEDIEAISKGRAAMPIGSKKNWGGKEYMKTAKGWKPVGKASGAVKQAHDTLHGSADAALKTEVEKLKTKHSGALKDGKSIYVTQSKTGEYNHFFSTPNTEKVGEVGSHVSSADKPYANKIVAEIKPDNYSDSKRPKGEFWVHAPAFGSLPEKTMKLVPNDPEFPNSYDVYENGKKVGKMTTANVETNLMNGSNSGFNIIDEPEVKVRSLADLKKEISGVKTKKELDAKYDELADETSMMDVEDMKKFDAYVEELEGKLSDSKEESYPHDRANAKKQGYEVKNKQYAEGIDWDAKGQAYLGEKNGEHAVATSNETKYYSDAEFKERYKHDLPLSAEEKLAMTKEVVKLKEKRNKIPKESAAKRKPIQDQIDELQAVLDKNK